MLSATILKNSIGPRLGRDIYGRHVRKVTETWLPLILKRARDLTPKDTQALANSLRVFIDSGNPPRVAGIRTYSRKALFVHGQFAIPSPLRRRSRPHYPPDNQSIRRWAKRKGIPVFLVRRAIARRGTPIIPFIAEAVDEGQPKLKRLMEQAARDIEREWSG